MERISISSSCSSSRRAVVFSHQDPQVARFGILCHLARQPPDVLDPRSFRAHVQVLEALAKGPHVHVENGDVNVWVVVFEQEAIFDGVHAADVGAVGIAPPVLRAGADALHEADALGRPPIGGTD